MLYTVIHFSTLAVIETVDCTNQITGNATAALKASPFTINVNRGMQAFLGIFFLVH